MEILDLEQVAEFLRLSKNSVRHLIKSHGLPYNQIIKNGKLTFDKSKVTKWWEKYNHPYTRFYRHR